MKWFGVYILTACVVLGLTLCLGRSAQVMGEYKEEERLCIVIDAGHGGIDGGAASCTGQPESTYNLEIALRLNDLLTLMGFDTRMIRTTDVSVYTEDGSIAHKKISDLKERVRICGEKTNTVLLSIHQNTFPDPSCSGAVVLYAATPGSKELAEKIRENALLVLDPRNKRQCKPASGVYLMEHLPCTGVLMECGFLSNPQEEALLRTANYQKKICAVIGCGLSQYLSG